MYLISTLFPTVAGKHRFNQRTQIGIRFFSDKAIFRRNPDGFQEKATQPEGEYGGKMCAGIYSVVPKDL
jgi:hypothetical protein